jgi:hypothetical protein
MRGCVPLDRIVVSVLLRDSPSSAAASVAKPSGRGRRAGCKSRPSTPRRGHACRAANGSCTSTCRALPCAALAPCATSRPACPCLCARSPCALRAQLVVVRPRARLGLLTVAKASSRSAFHTRPLGLCARRRSGLPPPGSGNGRAGSSRTTSRSRCAPRERARRDLTALSLDVPHDQRSSTGHAAASSIVEITTARMSFRARDTVLSSSGSASILG